MRRIDATTGIITTIAGTGYSGYSGDGGIPKMAGFEFPIGLAFDAASVTPGSSASYPVTLPAGATNVSAACLNLPAGAACSYSAANSTVTITTSANTPAGTYQIVIVFTETLPGAASGMIFLPLLLLPLMLLRKQWAGRGLRFAACVLVLAAAAFVTNGCGGSGSGSGGGGGTTPQTHQVTSSASVTLTVQ